MGSYCKILMYADDIVIYYNNKDIDKLKITLIEAPTLLKNWLKSQDLLISLKKTKFVILSRRQFEPKENFIELDGIKIKCSTIALFL